MRSLDSGKRRASGNQPGRLTAWLSALVVAFGVALPGAVAHSDAIGVEVIPAHLEPDIEVVQDAAHDVNEMHYTTNELFLVPEETEADILRVKYRHGAHRIAVRVKAAAFTPEMKPKLEGLINRWDDPIYFFLRTTPGQPIQTGLRLYYVDPPDDVLPCEGIRARFRDDLDVLRISIPRRCLVFPDCVTVGVYAGSAALPLGVRRFDDPMLVEAGDYEPAEGPRVCAPKGARVWQGQYSPLRSLARSDRSWPGSMGSAGAD